MKTFLISYLNLALFVVTTTSLFGQQNWDKPSNYIPGSTISVEFINESIGWTTGDFGSILKTTDGGGHWSEQNTGTTRTITSIDFLNDNDGFAAASYGTLLTTHNGGESWSTDIIGSSNLQKVVFTDANNGWIGADAFIYKTVDGGVSWDTVYQNFDAAIYDIQFVSSTEGWAVGMYYQSGYGDLILHTTDGGSTWTQQVSPVNQEINAVDFISATEGYVVTLSGDILKTIDAGNNWIEVSTTNYNTLNDVSFLNQNEGIVVGFGGLVLKTSDAGLTWTQMTSGVNQDMFAISRFSNKIWATGTGNVLHSGDNGNTWETLLATTSYPISGADFTDEMNGWAVGFYGTILRSTDGGQSWETQNPFTNNWFTDIEFYSQYSGYIVGTNGACYLTTDGGTTWNSNNYGITEGFNAVGHRPDSTAFAVGNNTILNLNTGYVDPVFNNNIYRSIHFINDSYGWISGDGGEILRTIDGGDNWSIQNSSPMYNLMSIFFVDQNTGWAVGTGGTVLKTIDGGLNWDPQNVPVTSSFTSVHFINPTTGWVIGDFGVILFTNDGGTTWIQEPSPVLSHLMSVNFINESTGIITGENGVILLADCSNAVLELNNFSTASDINTCTGSIILEPSEQTGMVTASFNGNSPVSFSENLAIGNLCPGIYEISTLYGCGLTQTSNVIIPIDSNYIFNNPFIDSLAQDSLGVILENCDIYYPGIDTAFINELWLNGYSVNVVWNIIDVNGTHVDTVAYDLNNGNGVYWLQLSVFCPTKSLGDYFAVSEAIYIDSSLSIHNWHETQNFEIYPNPTSNLVTISFEGNEAQLIIYDAQGKLIQNRSTIHSGEQVSLANVQTGVYFFELSTSEGKTVKRVVKN